MLHKQMEKLHDEWNLRKQILQIVHEHKVSFFNGNRQGSQKLDKVAQEDEGIP